MGMEFAGTQTIAVPVQRVWTFLMDVNNVAACAPGFQSLEVLGDEHWKAIVSVGVGPVKAKFTLDVTRPELDEPERMIVKGHGRAPGSAVDLSGDMHLTSLSEEETQMDWKANVIVSGTIASVGARLLNGTAERLTGQFFDTLKQKLQTSEASSEVAEADNQTSETSSEVTEADNQTSEASSGVAEADGQTSGTSSEVTDADSH